MTITELLRIEHTDISVDLLTHILGKSREFLYLNPGYELARYELARFQKAIKRLQKGEPLAYILGYKYFYGLKFKVNKHVLIPRPESEWLVERATAYLSLRGGSATKQSRCGSDGLSSKFLKYNHGIATSPDQERRGTRNDIKMLDLATGSGCLIISLASRLTNLPTYQLTNFSASDISPQALKVAKQNAKNHKVKINFIQSDLFSKIGQKFDVIIANLPYIPRARYEKLIAHNTSNLISHDSFLTSSLAHEPKLALTDGTDTWQIYEKFFAQLPKHLNKSGACLLEIDEESKPALQKMLKNLLPGWKYKFSKDLRGMWRYLELRDQTTSQHNKRSPAQASASPIDSRSK